MGCGHAGDGKRECQHLKTSELKWMKMDEFNSGDHCIYYCGQESLRRNGVGLRVKKSPKHSTWVQSQKQQNDLDSFPRQTIQHHSQHYKSMPQSLMPKKLKLTSSLKTYISF